VLAGSYDHRIDSKSRLVLPAAARPAFANGGFVSDQGNYVGLFPTQEWQEFVAKLRREVEAGTTPRRVFQVVSGRAFPIAPDGAGRVLLPPKLRARFDDEVTLIGSETHLAVYRPEEWASVEEGVGDLADYLEHLL
jgi:MraZ protein